MAEATPTISSGSHVPTSLTCAKPRDEYWVPIEGPTPWGHTHLSVLAFSNDAYMNTRIPSSSSLSPPIFAPWNRLTLLSHILQTIQHNQEKSKPTTDYDREEEEVVCCKNSLQVNVQECSNTEASDDIISWNSHHIRHTAVVNEEEECDTEEEEEEDWDSSGSEGEGLWEESDEDDDVVQFVSCYEPQVSCPSSSCSGMSLSIPPHTIQHISSFSSDESGFCERNVSDESSEEEEEVDGGGGCLFDEGLWHKFEEQGCFNDLFLPCPSVNRTNSNISSCTDVTVTDDCCSLALGRKVVTFKLKPQVHYIVAWRYAYKAARKGHWEELARDRDRFHKRIQSMDEVIKPCLVNKLKSIEKNSVTLQ